LFRAARPRRGGALGRRPWTDRVHEGGHAAAVRRHGRIEQAHLAVLVTAAAQTARARALVLAAVLAEGVRAGERAHGRGEGVAHGAVGREEVAPEVAHSLYTWPCRRAARGEGGSASAAATRR